MSAVPVAYEIEVGDSLAWRERAQCKGSTHLFFASPLERPGRKERRERMARRLCSACPVQHPCRDWARENREFGFWGGETEDERSQAGFRPSLRGPAVPLDPEAWDLRVLS